MDDQDHDAKGQCTVDDAKFAAHGGCIRPFKFESVKHKIACQE